MQDNVKWTVDTVIAELKSMARNSLREGMERFGINASRALGVSVPSIRRLAGWIGIDHALAMELWKSGIHEARILSGMVASPSELTPGEMEMMVSDFDSWDICDGVCGDLFLQSGLSDGAILEWARRDEEFVRRSAFVLIAYYAVHRKDMDDESFVQYLGMIEEASTDGRNFVKKAVDWALRQIGKRSLYLNRLAVDTAIRIGKRGERPGRWISSHSLRELRSDKVLARLESKESKKQGRQRSATKEER